MFTSSMTDEELLAIAYQDYLEIHMKIKIALETFVRNLRLNTGQRRSIHSVMETKTIRTKSRNTWNICFMNDSYVVKTDGRFFVGQFIYLPFHRGDSVDFLFMCVTPDFKLEKLTAHFLQRYKERYLDCNQINLRGMHPALYYMFKNEDRTQAYYTPYNWTEEDLREKCFLISSQGLAVVKVTGKLVTSITFLDQENLSRYKAQVYEEESLWKDFQNMQEPHLDSEIWQALYKKVFADPDRTKALLFNFLHRMIAKGDDKMNAIVKDLDDNWDDITDYFQKMSERVDEIREERKPKSLFDVGVVMEKRMKKG